MENDLPCQLSFTTIRQRVLLAIQCFYVHDRYLIETEIQECAISHRLAVYIEQQFAGWHVDCEFNKNGNDPKLAEIAVKSKRPDIIVHVRGPQGPNCLAVEIKKAATINTIDRDKCRRYVTELRYAWAVCVSFQSSSANLEWQSGKRKRFELDDLNCPILIEATMADEQMAKEPGRKKKGGGE